MSIRLAVLAQDAEFEPILKSCLVLSNHPILSIM